MLGSLFYTGCRLDRAAQMRTDEAWFAARLVDRASCVVPVWRDRSLVAGGEPPLPAALTGRDAAAVLPAADPLAFLGLDAEGRAWFAADVSAMAQDALAGLCDGAVFIELRRVGARMAAADGALLAYARAILHWHRRQRFCGVCGGPTMSRHGGHLRVCVAEACAAEHFPRTDPAVIMLVTRSGPGGDACLLARQARWPKGMMSTLAGFVEPGESLEEAVVREVREETGVVVDRIRYYASQPWPFPSSLMLGFRAEAAADAVLDFDRDELEAARWFSRAEIDDATAIGLTLPGADSIARRLILGWLAEEADATPDAGRNASERGGEWVNANRA